MTGWETGPTPNSAKGNPALAEASLLLAVFFVGTDVVSIKYALEGFPPLVLMPIRYVVAGLLLLAAIGLLGRKGTVALGTSQPWRAWGWWASPSTRSATRRA